MIRIPLDSIGNPALRDYLLSTHWRHHVRTPTGVRHSVLIPEAHADLVWVKLALQQTLLND